MAGTTTGTSYTPEPASAEPIHADFHSDTLSKPTPAMLEAMVAAEVGDEQKGEDPTTNALCRRVAELTGKEAAVLLPTGTMCNEIALRVHCDPGTEVICERACHIVNFEAGGPAAISGVMIHTIDGSQGQFSTDQLENAIRPLSRYAPESRLVTVEQTANFGGGAVWPLARLRAIGEMAKAHGLATHMDGARLLNACVATGTTAREQAAAYDSIWIDFTKGLGAFAGAALAGSTDFISQAWRIKQQCGGALRQSGYIAAAALYALDHHVERLAEDHALARHIGARIDALGIVNHVLPVESNIVIFELSARAPSADMVVERLLSHGIRVGAFGPRTVRAVTHLDVDRRAGDSLCDALAEIDGEAA